MRLVSIGLAIIVNHYERRLLYVVCVTLKYFAQHTIQILQPTRRKIGHIGDVPHMSWLDIAEHIVKQQRHAFTNRNKRTTTEID